MKEDIAMGNWIRSHMLLFFLGIFALLTCYPILFLFGASLMGNPEIGQVLGAILGERTGFVRLVLIPYIRLCGHMLKFFWIRRNFSSCSGIP